LGLAALASEREITLKIDLQLIHFALRLEKITIAGRGVAYCGFGKKMLSRSGLTVTHPGSVTRYPAPLSSISDEVSVSPIRNGAPIPANSDSCESSYR
jgi:hypothetical protein